MRIALGKAAFLSAMLVLLLAPVSAAKPSSTPTVEEAALSPVIAVCAYSGYEKESPKSYFGGVKAEYRIVDLLKGKLSGKIPVNFDFHDHSPCLEPPNWKFEEGLLPKAETRWILFLRPSEKAGEPFGTYRGSFGRWPATPENLARVKKLLENPAGE